MKLPLDVHSHDVSSDLALKAFKLSQTLREKWVNADYATKRRILEIVCLNSRLDDVSLAPTIRKPFDLLANDQSVLLTRGDSTPVELFVQGIRAWERGIRVLLGRETVKGA